MDGYKISFQFQVGLVKDKVTVDSGSLNLKSLKSKVSSKMLIHECHSVINVLLL